MNMNRYDKNIYYEKEDFINLKELIFQYFKYWRWFLFSIIITTAIGILFLKITPKKYLSESKIILETGNKESFLISEWMDMTDFADLSRNKLDDWIEILKSRRLMMKVVDKLDLNIKYKEKKGFLTTEIYKENSPITLKFVDEKSKYLVDSTKNYEIVIKSSKNFICKDLKTNNKIEGIFGKPLKFKFGEIIFFRNHTSNSEKSVLVSIVPLIDITLEYINLLDVYSMSKNGHVINLGMKSNLPNNANKIIDLLILQFQDDIIDDKKKIGKKTISFINDRLSLISKELGITDGSMEKFKSTKKIFDFETEGKKQVLESSRIEEQIKQHSIQLSLIDYMNNFINSNKNSLLPSNIGLTDNSLIAITKQYNELVLERDKMLVSSTKENPIVKNLNSQISELNNNIRVSLRNYKNTTSIAIGNLEKQIGQVSSKISELPSKEREFKDIFRKQQTIEALFLLLLQKREETQIFTASTPNIVKIVDKAFYNKNPIFPKPYIIIFISGFIGFIIPVVIFYINFLFDDKIKNKNDIEKVITNIPVIGYLPKSDTKIVDITSINSTSAEAFRLLRTNINFFLPEMDYKSKCVYVTSTISGEGKTFASINLALTLALANKKVLIIEADIRKPKIRENLGIEGNLDGVSDYLSGNINDISTNIISINSSISNIFTYFKQQSSFLKIDLFPSGKISPNPSELLMNGRFENIIKYGRENYDYIIVDTAPIGVVTDTLLINKYSDLVLFIIRVNYLQKNMLDILHHTKKEGKFDIHKTSILINYVDTQDGYGYNYTYGYNDKKYTKIKHFVKKYIFKA